MRLKTLVLEDDEVARDQIGEILRSHGHVVVAMSDAETAFEAHRRNPFDLMVVDWVVPGAMDGLELCRRVRRLPGGQYVSILVVTARNRPRDLEQVLEAGATDYLAKPVEREALRTRIRVAERMAKDLTRRLDVENEQARMRAQLLMTDRLASMGTLAAGVAHEINNPLASLATNLEYIAERLGPEAPPEVAEALADARSSTERVSSIVGALSRFSRAEKHTTEPVEVEQVIKTMSRLMDNEIKHRAKLVLELGGVPPALADEGRLGQLLLNLLKNAVEALPVGHSTHHEIQVRTSSEDEWIVIEVSDTGSGVPPELASRIFDPFFTTKPVGEGTGLGLSICHGIVSGFGGTIELVQGAPRGATFRVRLKKALAELRTPRPTPSSPVERPAVGGRVLVVDDEALIRRSLKRALAGSAVDLAENGRHGMELAMANDYDVILCDLMMPDVSGMELYELLAESRPHLVERIVFMTGGAFTTAARDFLDRIPNQFIEKPFDMALLRALVAERAKPR